MKDYKEDLKLNLTSSFIFLGIGALVQLIWSGLELFFLGHTNPNIIDTIIGFILICSLYVNFIHWISKRE